MNKKEIINEIQNIRFSVQQFVDRVEFIHGRLVNGVYENEGSRTVGSYFKDETFIVWGVV